MLTLTSDCYEQYRREYRFDSHVNGATHSYARTLRDCERACNNARFNCQGFSFSRNSGYSNGRGDRCELVDQDPRYYTISNSHLFVINITYFYRTFFYANAVAF